MAIHIATSQIVPITAAGTVNKLRNEMTVYEAMNASTSGMWTAPHLVTALNPTKIAPHVEFKSTTDYLQYEELHGGFEVLHLDQTFIITSDATGASTASILANAIDALKNSMNTIWVNDAGTYYVRHENKDPVTLVTTVTYTNSAGVVVADPTGTPGFRPVGGKDLSISQAFFDAINNGVGYSTGDVLVHAIPVNTSGTPVGTSFWLNTDSGAVIATPLVADIKEATQNVMLAPAQIGTPITAATMPAGGDALLGWLSSIQYSLALMAPSAPPTKVDHSGVIAGGAQVLMSAQIIAPYRRGIQIFNLDTAKELWFSEVGVASAGPGSVRIAPLGYYDSFITNATTGAISIFGTAGQQFTAYEVF